MQTSIFPNLGTGSSFKSPARVLEFVALTSVMTMLVTWVNSPYGFDDDSEHYAALAEGHVTDVIKPFAQRILHPLAAGFLAQILHLSTAKSFLLLDLAVLAAFGSFLWSMNKAKLPDWALGSLMVSPFVLLSFREYYLPDFFHAAILAWFFACLYHEKPMRALLPLFLLHLTREASLLLTVIVVGVGIHRRQWRLVGGSIGAATLGLSITKYAASLGRPNVHDMNDFLYVLLKIPYNFLKNCGGLVLWTDTLAANSPTAFPEEPLVSFPVPSFLPLGSIHTLGIYSFDMVQVVSTLSFLLMTFGILPTLVLADLKRWRIKLFQESPLYVVVALIYGLIAFVLGPAIGSSVGRLVGYGWPCFLIAAPYLMRQWPDRDAKVLAPIISGHVVACWLPYLLADQRQKSLALSLAVLAFLLVVHSYTWIRLRAGKSLRVVFR